MWPSSGSCQVGRREAAAAGIDEIYALVDRFGPERAIEQAADSLRALARAVAAGLAARLSARVGR